VNNVRGVVLMELKKKYANTDYIEKMYRKIENICKKENKDISNLEWLEKYNNGLDRVKKKGWIDTYIVIHLLAEKSKDIELHFSGTSKGILENAPMFAVWVMYNENGIAEGGNWYSGAIPKKYTANMIEGEIEQIYADMVFIEVKPEDKDTIKRNLDEICTNWQDTIIIEEIC
jgi:hypothetical protein